MKKTLLSASVVSVLTLTSFAALADGPDFYGRLDLSITNSETGATLQGGTNGVTLGESGTYIENNFSLLGVKGSEKITDGVEVLYQMEFQVENTSGKGDVFKARNTYLGIKTEGGSVLVGRNDTVFKAAEGGVDIFGNTNADMDRLVGGQTRSADGFWYYSPLIADMFTINATYLMEDNQASDDSQYALSVTFGDKGLKKHNYYVAGAYNKAIGGIDAYRAVAQFKAGDFKIGGLFQNSESVTNSDQDGNTYFINLAYNLNGVNLKVEYGADEAGFGNYYKNLGEAGADDVNVQNITIGADYRVAKSTLVFAHYAMYEGDYTMANAKTDLEDDNVFSVGMRYDF
ncbi:porin [Shewanella sp. 10N.286.48.B5]|uniref:porin n=1 Tax=Shewanella sp. 10N.286.48.B5 TaxID=1880834 RepID=UPI000C8385F6|nr:porin [Shewanella sp. 10N.286.48.B5]PMH88292.1 porin [Shewanella sp. 10N.286.48.B5]